MPGKHCLTHHRLGLIHIHHSAHSTDGAAEAEAPQLAGRARLTNPVCVSSPIPAPIRPATKWLLLQGVPGPASPPHEVGKPTALPVLMAKLSKQEGGKWEKTARLGATQAGFGGGAVCLEL